MWSYVELGQVYYWLGTQALGKFGWSQIQWRALELIEHGCTSNHLSALLVEAIMDLLARQQRVQFSHTHIETIIWLLIVLPRQEWRRVLEFTYFFSPLLVVFPRRAENFPFLVSPGFPKLSAEKKKKNCCSHYLGSCPSNQE